MTHSDHFLYFQHIKISKALLLNIFLVVSSLIAGTLFWWATAPYGIGVRRADVTFLQVAENFSRGQGFGLMDAFGQFSPVSRWAPLYSLLLAFFVRIVSVLEPRINAEQVAWVLGLLLASATTWVFALVIAKITNKLFLFIVFGVVALLSAPIFWEAYFYASPAPLFIFLSLLTIYFFMDYMRTFDRGTLFWAGLFAGLSILTDYLGLYLIPVMGLSMFLFTGRSPRRNFFALNHIIALGLLPVCIWWFRNYWVTGALINPKPAFSPITAHEWNLLWASLADWFSPLIEIVKIIPVGLVVLLAFSVLVASLVIYYRKRVYGNNESQEMRWKIQVFFIISYLFFLFVLKLFINPLITINESQVFLPVYAGLILLVIALLSNAKEIRFVVLGKPVFFLAFGVIFIFVLWFTAINTQRTALHLVNARNNGLGLNSAFLKNPSLALALKELHVHNPIFFSDDVEMFYWIARIPSASLEDIDQDLGPLFQPHLAEHDIIIVLTDEDGASAEVIKYYPSAEKIFEGDDSAIFILHIAPVN